MKLKFYEKLIKFIKVAINIILCDVKIFSYKV